MTVDELRALLKNAEDGFTERKPEAVKRGEIRQTVVAFANSVPEGREAVLFIGVLDGGGIQGVADTDAKQKLVRAVCERDCYPPIKCQPEVVEEGGKRIVAVVVPASDQRPHFAGPAFVRRGSESVAASKEMFDELIASRHEKARVLLRWKQSVISVREDGYDLVKQRTIPGGWRTSRECSVLDCNAHTLRLMDISSNTHFSIPLRQVEIGFDEGKHRNLVYIRP